MVCKFIKFMGKNRLNKVSGRRIIKFLLHKKVKGLKMFLKKISLKYSIMHSMGKQ